MYRLIVAFLVCLFVASCGLATTSRLEALSEQDRQDEMSNLSYGALCNYYASNRLAGPNTKETARKLLVLSGARNCRGYIPIAGAPAAPPRVDTRSAEQKQADYERYQNRVDCLRFGRCGPETVVVLVR